MDAQQPDLLADAITLLVVDDDQSVLDITALVLARFRFEGRPLNLLSARSAGEAKILLAERDDIAVLLLDVVMESEDAGLRLVEWIRNDLDNHSVRILLRTGQPGRAPERDVVENYDINDYIHKTDVTPTRLQVAITTAIRSYRDILRARFYANQAQQADSERQAKSRFLAHISHEIRTPLNGLIGIADLLQHSPLNAEQQELLADMNHCAESLLALVNDVLDMGRLEAGKLELAIQPLTVTPFLARIESIFSAGLRAKELQFAIRVAPDVPDTILADALRLQQILLNFIANAVKFTERGGHIQLQLSCQPLSLHEQCLCFQVHDSGVGMEAQILDHIFDAYEQGHATIASEFGGSGLGLSVCRSLATLMDGQVGAESEPGKGSRFWLRIPLRQQQSD